VKGVEQRDGPGAAAGVCRRHALTLSWTMAGRRSVTWCPLRPLIRPKGLFAEDAGLLPKGIFSRLSQASRGRSDVFTTALADLFAKMSKDGGLFGTEEIDWFNGGLFESGDVLPLIGSEIATLLEVSKLNWALIEPAIFGTLFERGLDPDQRAQLGAHYTDREAIWGLVEPVILRPLRREFAAMQTRVTELLLSGRKVTKSTPRANNPEAVFEDFLERLRRVRVLDPACGSGNFLSHARVSW
jgi:hypothetical protein